MQGKGYSVAQPLGVCRKLYKFFMGILSSHALANGSSRGRSSNNDDSEIKIEFSEPIIGKVKGRSRPEGQKMKIRNAKNDINVKASFAKGSLEEVKKKHRKKSSLQEGDVEDAKVTTHQERIHSTVFSSIDERSEAFIRSRLEAMRRSYHHDSGMF